MVARRGNALGVLPPTDIDMPTGLALFRTVLRHCRVKARRRLIVICRLLRRRRNGRDGFFAVRRQRSLLHALRRIYNVAVKFVGRLTLCGRFSMNGLRRINFVCGNYRAFGRSEHRRNGFKLASTNKTVGLYKKFSALACLAAASASDNSVGSNGFLSACFTGTLPCAGTVERLTDFCSAPNKFNSRSA